MRRGTKHIVEWSKNLRIHVKSIRAKTLNVIYVFSAWNYPRKIYLKNSGVIKRTSPGGDGLIQKSEVLKPPSFIQMLFGQLQAEPMTTLKDAQLPSSYAQLIDITPKGADVPRLTQIPRLSKLKVRCQTQSMTTTRVQMQRVHKKFTTHPPKIFF